MTSPLPERPIFLDYLATSPVDPRVADAALPYLTAHFGNPSSGHTFGTTAAAALARARASVAALLGTTPANVVFTGGGSEADTLAIRGAALAHRARGGHVITQPTEHPAVLAACDALARLYDYRITQLPVDEHGLVDPADLDGAIADDTVLVSIMHANNETGTIQPISALADVAHRHGVLFHTDAAQTVGKIPVSVSELGVDLLTVTGHKLYAPKGVGALYVADGVALEPLIYGGGQERGLRAGTENVALIVALGAATDIAREHLGDEAVRVQQLRDLLHRKLATGLPGRVHLNGHSERRLPNTLNVSIDGVRGPDLLAAVPNIAASTGSACHEGVDRPSPVLTAIGLPAERAMGAIRLSLGRWTSENDVRAAADALITADRSAPGGANGVLPGQNLSRQGDSNP